MCYNEECPFLKETTGEANRMIFRMIAGKQVRSCAYCGAISQREGCGARKIAELNTTTQKLAVHHFGTHRCKTKPPTKQRKQEIMNRLQQHQQKYPTQSARQFAQNEIVDHLRNNDLAAASRDADLFCDAEFNRRCITEARSGVEGTRRDGTSFDAVAGFKHNKSDKLDKFYIYRVHNGMSDGGEDYVFKSSKVAAQMMVDIDCDGPDNCLKGSVVFMDGAHGHTYGFITYVLWVYHPMLQKMLRLAMMDIRTENTAALTTFWELCLEMLREFTGDPKYIFNPAYFYCDQAPANFKAIKNVFGEEVRNSKVNTCVFHFLHKGTEHLTKIRDADEKRRARYHVHKMSSVLTPIEYMKAYKSLRPFMKADEKFANWINFWHVRRDVAFPAFRDKLLPRVNLAEAGNKTLTKKKVTLMEAAYHDTAHMLMQDRMVRNWKTQDVKIKQGRGPSAEVIASRARAKQVQMADELTNTSLPLDEMVRQMCPDGMPPTPQKNYLSDGSQLESPVKDTMTPQTVPSRSKTGRKRTPASKTPSQRKATPAKKRKTTPGKTTAARRLDIATNPLDMLKRQIDIAEEILGQKVTFSTAGQPARGPAPILHIIKRRGQIKKCAGRCKKPIDSTKPAPLNLLLRRKLGRSWKKPDGSEAFDPDANSYFHLDWQCVKRNDDTVEKRHLYVDDKTFLKLSHDHFEELKDADLLEYVIAAKK